MKRIRLLLAAAIMLASVTDVATAQMIRPPVMTMPGFAQMRAINMQRHQARTLLYREALEELRRNPRAADVAECVGAGAGGNCLSTPPPQPAAEAAAEPARRRIALLIGNNAYSPPIPKLETPAADVDKIAAVLRDRFGYVPRILKNAAKADIIAGFNKVAAETLPGDSVVLFYAGHGYLMDDTGLGFWIPVDASVKTAANWISNTDIGKLLAAIPARQLILVSDSCFSGSLTKEQKVGAGVTPNSDEILRRRSVLVLSSGDEEPVSDEGKGGHSIFAWNLARVLDGIDGTAPGYMVWKSVHGQVVKEAAQEPQYGAVISAGHTEGGEYLFQRR